MKRSELKRGKPLKAKTPLSRTSELKRKKPLQQKPVARVEMDRLLAGLDAKYKEADTKVKRNPKSRSIDPEIRFAKATRRGEPSDYRPDLGPCLIFTGADNGNGYGQFRYNGKNGYVHRYAWERVNGPIPGGLTVDHLCRVRRCAEVAHLELVDAVTNYRRGVRAWTHCRNGMHERTPENLYVWNGLKYCNLCRKEGAKRAGARQRKPPGSPDPRVKYDQTAVRAEVALVRAGEQTIAQAARAVGCNPNYLGRRIWEVTRKAVLARDEQACSICGRTDLRLEVHHRRNRGRGGSSNPLISFGMGNLISLCVAHHREITENLDRQRYLEQGWIVSAYQNPENVAVWLYGRGFCFLNAAGGIETVDEVA